MKIIGNDIWNNATANSKKMTISMRPEIFHKILDKLNSVAMNYCAYENDSIVRMAINRNDVDYFKLIVGENDLKSLRFLESNKVYNPPKMNTFGTNKFKYIPNKNYCSGSTDVMLATAEKLRNDNIEYSGRVYANHTTITVSQEDVNKVLSIQKDVVKQREKRISINKDNVLEGAELYKDIKNKVCIYYPELDVETFKAIKPKLNRSGVLYSAVKRSDKGVMFAFEQNTSYDFNKILEQELSNIYSNKSINHSLTAVQVGDFFEFYDNEAEIVSDILKLNITSKNGKPMVGIPKHILETDIKLLKNARYEIKIQYQIEAENEITFTKLDNTTGHHTYEVITDTPEKSKSNFNDKKNTLIVDIYGGPGAGKSTTALQLVAELKKHGYHADYVSEVAKDLVYAKNFDMLDGSLENQSKILSEQKSRLDLLLDNVDVAVTDSPLLLNTVYLKEKTPEYIESVFNLYNEYNNYNIIVERDLSVEFEKEGRIHNLEESIEKDSEISTLLDTHSIKYQKFHRNNINGIVDGIVSLLSNEIQFETLPSVEDNSERTLQNQSKTISTITNDEQLSLFDNPVVENKQAQKNLRKDNRNAHLFSEKPTNFHITDDNFSEGGAKSKFKANIVAIQTLQRIESENRYATPEEQEVLSKYIGWGGLSSAFDEHNDKWSSEYVQLKDLLTDKEYNSARTSTLDSFYTSPAIIDSIYSALKSFGFNGGNVLEPAMGVGNFFGRMPEEMQKNSKLHGIEIDSLSGRIAKQLYPDAVIQIQGFEQTNFNNNSFDIAIGNIPFGDFGVIDKNYDSKLKIHDYFFAKTLDKVKVGGIIAFVTSKGTLDKHDNSFRRQLAEKADLIGTIRLPNTAFKTNAGTEVTSDIIFLQKRSEPPQNEPEWVQLGLTENGLPINKYFEQNPYMVLGKIVEGNKLYGRHHDTMCIPIEGENLKDKLNAAIQNLHAKISAEKMSEIMQKNTESKEFSIPKNLRNHSFFINHDGKVCFKYSENNCIVWSKDKSKSSHKRAVDFIRLRDCTRDMLDAQEHNCSDEELKALQDRLNTYYDNFYKNYGLLHGRTNKSYFRDDVSYPLVCALESKIDKNKLIEKSALFTKRTIKPAQPVTHVDTAQEALIMSVAERASVDFDYMEYLSDMPKDMLIQELKGEIYPVPELSEDDNIVYQEASEYLSGDIRKKLDVASTAAESNSIYEQNIAALTKVLPEKLKAGDISVKVGAMWIDPKYYQQFMYECFKTPDLNRIDKKAIAWKRQYITLDYSEYTNSWNIKNKSTDYSVTVNKTYGTDRRNAYKIFEDILNLKDPKVYKTEIVNGEEKRIIDYKETKLAQNKAEKIRESFKNWIFRDPNRRAELVTKYNKIYNSIRPREYDGSHLTFPGMNTDISLHSHQKNAIAHALYGGNTLFAHDVGAGKTYEMIATAMESKRLGLCSKSLFAVPNHLTEQIGDDFMKLYPNANILVATKNDFKKENRQRLVSKIATGNFDAVIIGHTQLGMIPISKERQEEQLTEQISDIVAGIEKLKYDEGEKFQIKAMERTKKSLQKQLTKLKKSNQDDVITFEQLGVDKLFVDEAHEFKNLYCPTKLQNVAGISSSASQRALDLFMKCQYLDEKTGSKGIVFATGTPISNSVTELHTMIRFLQYDLLKEKQLNHFDNWVSVFGEQKTEYELAPAGNSYRPRTRIANYVNLPELLSMFKQCADVQTSDTLNLDVPECELHIVNAEISDFQKELVSELALRADDVQKNVVDPSDDNMLKITSDGRKVGLDPRLIDPSFEDNPNSKLNQCVRNVFDIYNQTSSDKLTQIIFCDLGVPHKEKSFNINEEKDSDDKSVNDIDSLEEECDFCVYDDIKSKLIEQGIPENEIAFIHSAKTEKAKSELFEKVRNGDVRILLGSTSKMGTGTNIQDRLIALHDLDIPWRPADLSQRKGRMVRQGNVNNRVHLYRYVTKGTFDAYSYQLLESKQKFISQIITSKSPARTCEDVDQQALSYSEIKALCTGDERIKELMVLDNEVKSLTISHQEWQNTQYEMEDYLRKYPDKKSYYEKLISNISKDLDICKKLPIDPETKLPAFKISIQGNIFTDKTEAAKALKTACKESLKSDDTKIIGNIHGFPIRIYYSHLSFCLVAVLQGAAQHKIDLGDSFPYNLRKIENLIFTMESRLEKTKLELEKINIDAADAKALLSEPFAKESELTEKSSRLTELRDELNNEASAAAQSKSKGNGRTYYFEKAKIKQNISKKNTKPSRKKSIVIE